MVRALVVAGAVFGIFAAAGACAETFERTVKANTRTAVGAFFTYSEGLCQASVVPDVTVRSKPANGVVAIEVQQNKLGPKTNCPGATVRGPVFIYTPAKGFKGVDEFALDIPFARNPERPATIHTYTYRIRVE